MTSTGKQLLLIPLASVGVAAAEPAIGPDDPFYPLLATDLRPYSTLWQTDYSGEFEIGMAGVDKDNSQFGQYNGYHEEGAGLIGRFNWQHWDTRSSWRVRADDLGRDTREGSVEWWLGKRYKFTLEFDSQLQVRNRSATTPFFGTDVLRLPSTWTAATTTGGFSSLDASQLPLYRELKRQGLTLGFDAMVSEHWSINARISQQQKTGTGDVGGAFYIDAAGPHSAILPLPVDYTDSQLELGVGFSGEKLLFNGSYSLSRFENEYASLTWQNPYITNAGADVDYPNGLGALALAPDNQLQMVRGVASYLFSPRLRLDVDASYGITEQNDDLLPYSVNPALTISEPLPRTSLDASLATTTASVKLHAQPLNKLGVDLGYRLANRDYETPRDGYLYIRGDSMNQPASDAYRVYNTAHDNKTVTYSASADYRLPLRSKLSLGYDYQERTRQNAAVEETAEDIVTIQYRIKPWQPLSLRLELSAADRGASTYNWDQSYYARLDTELINATPDTQRYSNHPLLSQYHLANRERGEAKLDVSWTPIPQWQLSLTLLGREDDYDKTELGLVDSQLQRAHFTASYSPAPRFNVSAWVGADKLSYNQAGRAFRGGAEKNAFVTTPPLPQASDPTRNWESRVDDDLVTAGLNLFWQIARQWDASAEWLFTDTLGQQAFTTYGATDLDDMPLADQETRINHWLVSGRYHYSPEVSLKVEYQYYEYEGADWALDGLSADSLAKVLTLGESVPNEAVQYLGLSAIFRWQ